MPDTLLTYRSAVMSLAVAVAVIDAGATMQRPAALHAPTFVVVVHKDNPTVSIGREDLSRIFLKRSANWPSGGLAEPVDLAAKDRARVAFSKAVHRKAVASVRAYWQQQIFSGRDVPPPEKASESDVMAYVRDHVGAVGYVSASAELPLGLKILDVQ